MVLKLFNESHEELHRASAADAMIGFLDDSLVALIARLDLRRLQRRQAGRIMRWALPRCVITKLSFRNRPNAIMNNKLPQTKCSTFVLTKYTKCSRSGSFQKYSQHQRVTAGPAKPDEMHQMCYFRVDEMHDNG